MNKHSLISTKNTLNLSIKLHKHFLFCMTCCFSWVYRHKKVVLYIYMMRDIILNKNKRFFLHIDTKLNFINGFNQAEN